MTAAVLFAEVVLAAVTVPAPSNLLADAESRRREEEEVANDVEAIGRSELEKFARTAEGVLVSETVAHDLRIAEVLCVGRQLEIARDSVAAEAGQYARRVAKQTEFATVTQAPVPVDTVSDRFAVLEAVVDSAENLEEESEGATTAVAVAALY